MAGDGSGQNQEKKPTDDRAQILEQIRNPLVFFALALLIIEGAMGFVVGKAELSAGWLFACLLLMSVLFLAVVGIVAAITIWFPTHLYESIQEAKEKAQKAEDDSAKVMALVDSPGFKDLVTDMSKPPAPRKAVDKKAKGS